MSAVNLNPDGNFESWRLTYHNEVSISQQIAEARLLRSTVVLYEQFDRPDHLQLVYKGESTIAEPEPAAVPEGYEFKKSWNGVLPSIQMWGGPNFARQAEVSIPSLRVHNGISTVDKVMYEFALPGRDHAGALAVYELYRHFMPGSPEVKSDRDIRLRESSVLTSVARGIDALRLGKGYPGKWTWRINDVLREEI